MINTQSQFEICLTIQFMITDVFELGLQRARVYMYSANSEILLLLYCVQYNSICTFNLCHLRFVFKRRTPAKAIKINNEEKWIEYLRAFCNIVCIFVLFYNILLIRTYPRKSL